MPDQDRCLSVAQRELLAEFAASQYADRHVNSRYDRTARVLVRRGLLRPTGPGWYEITDAGRLAVGANPDDTPSRGRNED